MPALGNNCDRHAANRQDRSRTPEEAEEVFATSSLFRSMKKGYYAAFVPTAAGRYLAIVFDLSLFEQLREDIRSGKRRRKLKNITLKIDPLQIQAIKKLTILKSMPYQTLIRRCLAEDLREELDLVTK